MENAENNVDSTNSKFVEFWVPVPISNVQLEQYCATLLSNDTALHTNSRSDTLGALKDLFVTIRKCCNHPYTVDLKVEQSLIKDKDPSMAVDVGVEASGKLRFLDRVLPEIQKQQWKVLILFQSIKLSSVDAIIIFDSELNPSNDLKSLQKLSIGSQSEQIMVFRLYSLSTVEEKILKLAEINVVLDVKSQSLRSNYDALLVWGASDLFDKLTKFHSQTVVNISSEESFLKDVVEDFLYILSHKCKSNDTTSKSIITRVQNTLLHAEVKTHLPDGDQQYIFWKKTIGGTVSSMEICISIDPAASKKKT
ncbi:putative DNA helicase [Helianthus annuus]|nr:putative DNA helicase [Helianthus annuus]